MDNRLDALRSGGQRRAQTSALNRVGLVEMQPVQAFRLLESPHIVSVLDERPSAIEQAAIFVTRDLPHRPVGESNHAHQPTRMIRARCSTGIDETCRMTARIWERLNPVKSSTV